ncbi:MAG TPA: Wzz/FepE/Etk N-terminal domain-containing protein [Pseudomonas sp.]
MEQVGNPVRYDDDEIDLRELFAGLWAERLLILLVTLVIGAGAAAYAFLATPVYEAKSSLLPPRLSDIAGYNVGRAEARLVEFKVADVYSVFTRNLTSEAMRRSFFRDVYLPSLSEAQRAKPEDALWKRFNEKVLSAKAPDVKTRPDHFDVRVEHDNPQLATEWVNLFVQRAVTRSRDDMQQNVLSEIDTRIQSIERQIEVLRSTAMKRREDRVAQLREALTVAEAVGQEQPLITTLSASSAGELTSSLEGSLLYMRGARAIRAELQVLESRQSDDPFIAELRSLQDRLEFLKGIDVKPDNVAVFTLDSAAEVPETPIKPKKALILAIGVVLGGMLGVFIALVRRMIRKGSRATT